MPVKAERPSARTGALTERYLLQGIATCASCGGRPGLSGSGRRNRAVYYFCRSLHCPEHAYAQAARLDAHVLAVLEEAVSEADPSTWVVVPGDDREVEEAEAALEEAREDLDSWLADTKLRGILGPDRYAGATADRVTVVNKAEADLEAARERHGGRYELGARLWLQEWGWAERKRSTYRG